MSSEAIGKWAFIIGLVIAVLASFITSYASIILLVLFLLGLVIGFMNISDKDHIKFLVASIALITLGVGSINALAILGVVSTYVNAILGNFIAFVSAAVLVVSIKSLVETSQ